MPQSTRLYLNADIRETRKSSLRTWTISEQADGRFFIRKHDTIKRLRWNKRGVFIWEREKALKWLWNCARIEFYVRIYRTIEPCAPRQPLPADPPP